MSGTFVLLLAGASAIFIAAASATRAYISTDNWLWVALSLFLYAAGNLVMIRIMREGGLGLAISISSIARALAFDADLLLMDEPFGALDEIVRDHLNEELLKLWDRTNKTICFVTHSIPEAVYLSTKIVVMSPRPGRVTDVIESTLPKERPLDIRETPEFLEIAHRVREGLRAGHSYEL